MIGKGNLALFHEQIPSIYKDIEHFICMLTQNHTAKEEILQDSIEIALKNIHQLREPEKMKNWIFTIAKRQTAKYYLQTDKELLTATPLEDMYRKNKAACESSLDILLKMEQSSEILGLFDDIDGRYSKILILRHYFGLPLNKIAEVLDMNYSTVGCHYRRGLQQLRAALERTGKTFQVGDDSASVGNWRI